MATVIRQGKQTEGLRLRVPGGAEGGGLGPDWERLKLIDGASGEAQNFHQQEVFSPAGLGGCELETGRKNEGGQVRSPFKEDWQGGAHLVAGTGFLWGAGAL